MRRWITGSCLGLCALLVVACLITPLFGVLVGSTMGFSAFAMERLADCPRAVELLGQPLRISLLGRSCGSAEISGQAGTASWVLPVSGPQGSGSFAFRLQMSDGQWQLESGQLRIGEQKLDVGACVNGGLPETRLPERPAFDFLGGFNAQCESGEFIHCQVLGDLYRGGHLIPKNLARARAYYEMACRAGYSPGCALVDSVDAESRGAAPPTVP